MATLKIRRFNGGARVEYESSLFKCSSYGMTAGCALRALADEWFSPDTSAHQALVWYAKESDMWLAARHAVGHSMAAVINAWARTQA